jgi:insecticidal toxin complex protein TccC
MSTSIHRHTPTLNVVDGRGVKVREVTYLCNESTTRPQARITRHLHDINGQVLEQRSHANDRDTPDLMQVNSLSGVLLKSSSVDAGWRLTLCGEDGQALQSWDSRGSHWQTEYDDQIRPQVIYQQSSGQPRQAIQRFTYANGSSAHARNNQCGRLIRQDDQAGKRLVSAYDLTGRVLQETRAFVKEHQGVSWPQAPADRDKLLEAKSAYTTTWRYAPTGENLEQKDAKGNVQRFWFDVAGQLKKVTLQLNGSTEQKLILDEVVYNVQGQLESQTMSGKIISNAVYTPENGRVTQRTISRTQGRVLQKTRYAYDAVGNVVSIHDHTKPIQHNANQRIEPINTYVYDSLYQLIKASGREEQGASRGALLPDWSSSVGDRSRLLNFTEHYTYDDRANLVKLQHRREGNNYTREMHITPDSNHALPKKTGDSSADFAKGFDSNGNLQWLQTGQPLQWDASNQLQSVILIERDSEAADTETYLYDGNGQRARKRQTKKARTLTHVRDVSYLPGLEIRVTDAEELEVITLQAGGCSVHCLHWNRGIPSKIANDALRHNFTDHLGSTTLELNAEGELTSEESYYPFGGTAWRATRNELEAKYRTIRYSGKERDASGLYYYGRRYYAPWLQRWISPDPAGAMDGLNMYRFVGNNPVSHQDYLGLMKYEIESYSTGAMGPAPPSVQQLANHNNHNPNGLTFTANMQDTERHQLAYDLNWSTRSLLYMGAGNQIGDILNSGETSSMLTSHLRANLGMGASNQLRAEHAVAASAGLCDEFAAVSSHLAASSLRGFGTPVFIAQIPGHTFTLLGDRAVEDPVVVDPWVSYSIPDKLSTSRYNHPNLIQFNTSAAMPQDPRFHISVANVATLAPLYTGALQPLPGPLDQDIQHDLNTSGVSSWVWNQISSQQHSKDVWGFTNNDLINFAEVPANHWNRLDTTALLPDMYAMTHLQQHPDPFKRM